MTPPNEPQQAKDKPQTGSLFGRRTTAPTPSKPRFAVVTPTPAPAPSSGGNPEPHELQSLQISNLNEPEPVMQAEPHEILTPHLEKCLTVVRETFKATVDARHFSKLGPEAAEKEIVLVVEQICQHSNLNVSPAEMKRLAQALIDEVLGLGPIEPLLARDDISEIMVNGPDTIYVEVDGLVTRSPVTFRDEEQLLQVCQRIASRVGRRVDDSSPICDARLQDGSRVNIILPPLAIDGTTLTIRKFKRDKLTLEKLLSYGSIDALGVELIRMIAGCRVNTLVSGGTGSGKTTMLNCLTRYIHPRERVITCEDSAELQLQQPHVVRLETRHANVEGAGEVSMRDLVKNCLRMRPERIIVGEVRGPEAFDLLQAMNTGHDGSMGTVHANTPRDAIARLESMIAMNRLNIPPETIRAQIASSVNVIVQVQRLRDGSRKVMSITEVTGMEGEIITMQDLMFFDITGEDENGNVAGQFRSTGLRPRFYPKLREFGMQHKFDALMERYCIQTQSRRSV
jgi:pilus assembly protein CpaF